MTFTLALPTEAVAAFHGLPPADLLTDRPVSWRWLSEQPTEFELPARTPMIAVVPRAAETRRPAIDFTEDQVLLVDGKRLFQVEA